MVPFERYLRNEMAVLWRFCTKGRFDRNPEIFRLSDKGALYFEKKTIQF